MRFVNCFFKYFTFFALGTTFGLFAFNTYLGYTLLNRIADPKTGVDITIQKMAEFYKDFSISLKQVDTLIAEIDNSKKTPICEIICSPSYFAHTFTDYTADTLVKYYDMNPKAALSDPDFRLLIDKLHRYSRMLPQNTKDTIRDLIENSAVIIKNPAHIIASSADVQLGLILEAPRYVVRLRKALAEEETIDKVRDLRLSCNKTIKASDIQNSCNALMEGYGTSAD